MGLFRAESLVWGGCHGFGCYNLSLTSVIVTGSMPLHLIGLNHHTAPLAIRERVAIAAETVGSALATLRQSGAGEEAAILSTCNRTELYVSGHNADSVP